MGSDGMDDVDYTKNNKTFLKFLRDGLAFGYPNPNRDGCPPGSLLTEIADRKLPIEDIAPWIGHLTACSPCFREYSALVEARKRRAYRYLGVAAGIIVAITSISWFSFYHRQSSGTPQNVEIATIDLQHVSLTRGGDESTGAGPKESIELRRGVSRLTIRLPRGSRDGQYEVGILATSGVEVATAPASTTIAEDQSVTLITQLTLAKLAPGPYLLAWRRSGLSWSYQQIQIK
jgi:hypothetical protein